MADTWKKVEVGDSWNYKDLGENAELEGVYTNKEEHVGENDSNVYSVETKDHETVNVWGSTVLDARMSRVKIGEEIKIVYLGAFPSEKRKGKTYHNFEVYHRVIPMEKVADVEEDEIPLPDSE